MNTWTTEIPTENGFYWYRYDPQATPEVVEWEEDMQWISSCGNELRNEAANNTGEFWPEKLPVPGKASMGVYVCNQFTGHYPVGTAAVVVAESQQHAAELLNEQCKREGLPGDANANGMALVMQDKPQTVILCDGNY